MMQPCFTFILVHHLCVSVCLTRELYGEGLLPARRMYLPFLLSLIDLFAKVRFTLTVVIVVWLSCMPFEEKYEWAETAQNVAAFDRTPAAAC
ncbi:hypothetical protein C2Y68_19300 [Salmonella enterica]|nr:hypothetical protein [Salmonella enterica]ECU1103575.1 hypothetical protein [Salmonella enterica subsp. enterica]ESE91599.1 hypothetical protein SEH50133_04526 [Salmonella enterica subsp. houtenae serovar 50:g,z51:- str. 01-0133]EAQ7682377.1 hypothetical protein [Salmonella enterica]EAU6363563.1 hypothetical protein [Salmonella enterica]